MEITLFIVAMVTFALSIIIFIAGTFKHGWKGYLQTNTAKMASLFFLVYVITIISYFFVSSN